MDVIIRRNAADALETDDAGDGGDDDDNHLLPYQIAVFSTTMTNHSGISES